MESEEKIVPKFAAVGGERNSIKPAAVTRGLVKKPVSTPKAQKMKFNFGGPSTRSSESKEVRRPISA